jgi:hypothetical protein
MNIFSRINILNGNEDNQIIVIKRIDNKQRI